MIVLDTCAIIWDALDAGKLSAKATQAIRRHEHELIVCDISLWEIAMLIKKKRLKVECPAAGFINLALQARAVQIKEISPEIAELSVNLGRDIGADPADRLIAATSILLNAPIITADRHLREATSVETIW